jgi:hypothetical protein
MSGSDQYLLNYVDRLEFLYWGIIAVSLVLVFLLFSFLFFIFYVYWIFFLF